jgi:hypothetical protein
MKRFFGIALVSVMAHSAYAGSLTLDGRFDYGNTTVDDVNQGSATQITRLKLDGQGSAGKVKFRSRVDLTNDTGSVLQTVWTDQQILSISHTLVLKLPMVGMLT